MIINLLLNYQLLVLIGMSEISEKSVSDAIQEVMAWSSIFDYHPTVDDLVQNLRIPANEELILEHIQNSDTLSLEGDVIYSELFPRNENLSVSKELAKDHLSQTIEVLEILNSCKVITGLAVTGSVAAGVNDVGGDVDVLIITKPGWVWRVRALSIYLSHKHPNGSLLCPNMVMADNSLVFEQSIYGAREMMRIIPMKDNDGIKKLYEANPWITEMLPNSNRKEKMEISTRREYPWWWSVMSLPVIGRIVEIWEANRRIKQLSTNSKSSEAIYSKSICRGHENSHKRRIEKEYSAIVEAV